MRFGLCACFYDLIIWKNSLGVGDWVERIRVEEGYEVGSLGEGEGKKA